MIGPDGKDYTPVAISPKARAHAVRQIHEMIEAGLEAIARLDPPESDEGGP